MERRRPCLWRLPLVLPVHPSPRLRLLRRIGCGIGLTTLLYTSPACLLLLWTAVRERFLNPALSSAILDTAGHWWLIYRDGCCERAWLSSNCHAHPSFIVISLIGTGGSRSCLALLPDSLPADDQRRLRARLRLDRSVWKVPEAVTVRHRQGIKIALTPVRKTIIQITGLAILSVLAMTLLA